MYLLVGLGNPEPKYSKNLRNLGFMAIDIVAEKLGASFNKKAFLGLSALTSINGEKVLLLKPQTYMNLSGNSVQMAMAFYKIPPQNLLVFYDDLDIEIGSLRIREKGSAGTHNGMRDIVNKISSQDFKRVRIGTKPRNDSRDIVDYVLSDVKKEDEQTFKEVLNRASDAGVMFASGKSLDEIMRKFNG